MGRIGPTSILTGSQDQDRLAGTHGASRLTRRIARETNRSHPGVHGNASVPTFKPIRLDEEFVARGVRVWGGVGAGTLICSRGFG